MSICSPYCFRNIHLYFWLVSCCWNNYYEKRKNQWLSARVLVSQTMPAIELVYNEENTWGSTIKHHPLGDTAAAKSLQSCPTLCDPIDGSPPGSPVPGIFQARTLEWVAIFFSNAGKWKVKVKSLSHVQLLETSWTAAYQAPPSMGFSRQEYWSGVPLLSPNTLPRFI